MTGETAPAALFKEAQAGSEEAMERLARMNAPLVRSVAARFLGRAETDDIIQTGNIGLIKAIMRFDPALGNCFSTFAVPTVAGEIKRFLRDNGLVKICRRYKDIAAAAFRLIREAEAAGEEPPRPARIAELIGAEPSDVAAALTAAQPCVSMDEPIPELDGATVSDTVADLTRKEDDACDRVLVQVLLERLPEREKALLRLRFDLCLTQKETADRLGMSQAQVSRLEKRILSRLRSTAGER